MSQFLFERWQQPQQKQINHFYKNHNQNVSCHKSDLIYLARDITKTIDDAPIIAVTFIRDISTKTESLHLLRSLFVAPPYRNQGVAKRLLAHLLQEQLPSLTVICQPSLTKLYTSAGFHINKPSLPVSSPYLAKFTQQQKVILTKP